MRAMRRAPALLAALLLAATPLAGQKPAVGPAPKAPVKQPLEPAQKPPGDTGGILAQIRAVTAQLKGLQADLQALQAQLAQATKDLRDLMAAKPPAPDAQASDETRAAYQASLAQWQNQVVAKQAQIDQLQQAMAKKQHEVAAKQAELAQLQQALQAAQRRTG